MFKIFDYIYSGMKVSFLRLFFLKAKRLKEQIQQDNRKNIKNRKLYCQKHFYLYGGGLRSKDAYEPIVSDEFVLASNKTMFMNIIIDRTSVLHLLSFRSVKFILRDEIFE